MTNYNERLDEVLWSAIMHEPAPTKPGEEYKATWNEPVIKKAKQALTSLIKELVAEAKPREHIDAYTYSNAKTSADIRKIALNQYEQNLLKALEDK